MCLAMLVACGTSAFALDPSLDVSQYAHTAWKIREGFTRGTIFSIAQTPDGYLWLGTEFGLSRFDGVQAVPWEPPKGEHLPSNYIRDLLVTRDGTLWIGTAMGLASWKNGKLRDYPEIAGHPAGPLLQDRHGTVWVGIQHPGRLCIVQAGTAKCDGAGRFGNGVLALYVDHKGSMWVGAQTGLWRWGPSPPSHYDLGNGLAEVKTLIEGDDGALLVATGAPDGSFSSSSEGLKEVVEGRPQRYELERIAGRFRPTCLFRSSDGSLWVGTVQGLVHLHQGKVDRFNDLSGDTILSLFEDHEGNVWVSTEDGLDRFRDFAVPTISVKQGLSSSTVHVVEATPDGSIWIATAGQLDRWQNGYVTVYGSLNARGHDLQTEEQKLAISARVQQVAKSGLRGTVYSLGQDDSGRLWTGGPEGAFFFHDGRFFRVRGIGGGNIFSIATGVQGRVWISTLDQGLMYVAPERLLQRFPWPRLGHKSAAVTMLPDQLRGGLWLGFYDGGIAYLKDGQIQASYNSTDGLGQGSVTDLQFFDGTVWVATRGGLSRVKDGHITTLNSKNGLLCDAVYWIIEDNDHSTWLNQPCGLVRITHSEMEAWVNDPNRIVQTAVFDSSDGVRSHSSPGHFGPKVTKSPDGRIWFSPLDGVSFFDPRHLAFNKLPPPVLIEQIIADRKTYAAASGLRLPPRVRDLEIDYTALSLVAPEKVRFRYKLEGLDRDWQDVGNRRQAFYTNLPARNYRFRVIAANNSGVWNDTGAALNFTIVPAYYQTTWFRALCVAAALALLWAAYLVRVRQLRQQEKKLRDVVETIPTIAWTALPDGWVDFSNHHWEEYTGLPLEKGSGSGWEAAVHPEDVKRHAQKWRASVASGEPFESEARYRRTDGEYRWFLVRAVPLRDTGGKILKWYGTKTDIEDRRRAEQLQAEFAHISRVSTLGELAASISHELKQPIAAAMTNADTGLRWLKRDQPNVEEASEAVERIVQDGARAAHIIDRLRALYTKSSPKREPLDFNEIVQEMVELLRGEADRYEVSIRTELAPDLTAVRADRVQLQQVLMNLMLNGIEAMQETGGVLTIRSQPNEDGGVLISIGDSGVGLPPEKEDQIFNAFFTTKPEGSGMGLAISRSIIESHGGRLWATANDGRGATFHFTLKMAVGDVKHAAAEV